MFMTLEKVCNILSVPLVACTLDNSIAISAQSSGISGHVIVCVSLSATCSVMLFSRAAMRFMAASLLLEGLTCEHIHTIPSDDFFMRHSSVKSCGCCFWARMDIT